MKLTKKDMPGLLEAARPLMEWIQAHGHPMVSVIVGDDRAEVVESLMLVIDENPYPEDGK